MKTEQTGMVEKPKKRVQRQFSAKEKSQAVLSLWSGRRNASALMRELSLSWGMLHSWEQRAIQGMLTALNPSWKEEPESATRLPERVEQLIARTIVPRPASAPATELN